MKEVGRARRVADKTRVKQRAIRMFQGPLRGRKIEYAHRVAENLTVCSCWACGNPRKWFGHPTIQERRFEGDGG